MCPCSRAPTREVATTGNRPRASASATSRRELPPTPGAIQGLRTLTFFAANLLHPARTPPHPAVPRHPQPLHVATPARAGTEPRFTSTSALGTRQHAVPAQRAREAWALPEIRLRATRLPAPSHNQGHPPGARAPAANPADVHAPSRRERSAAPRTPSPLARPAMGSFASKPKRKNPSIPCLNPPARGSIAASAHLALSGATASPGVPAPASGTRGPGCWSRLPLDPPYCTRCCSSRRRAPSGSSGPNAGGATPPPANAGGSARAHTSSAMDGFAPGAPEASCPASRSKRLPLIRGSSPSASHRLRN
jgi:hypothetical protein